MKLLLDKGKDMNNARKDRKKTALISLGACVLIGVLAIEAVKYTDAKKDQKSSLIVLPEPKDAKFSRDTALLESRIHETKRLLFNRDQALENSHLQSIREKILHKDNVIASLESENQNLLKSLKVEQEKLSQLEKSMNTLLVTLDSQKSQSDLAQRQQYEELGQAAREYGTEKAALIEKLSALEQRQERMNELLHEKESVLKQLHHNSTRTEEALELASHQYTYDQISSNELKDQNRYLENQRHNLTSNQYEKEAAQAELAAQMAFGELQHEKIQELEESLKDILVRFAEKDEAYQALLAKSTQEKSQQDEALDNLSSDHEEMLENLAIERAVRVLGLRLLNQENAALMQAINTQKKDREALAERLVEAEDQVRVIKSQNKYAHEEKNVILDSLLAKGLELEDELAIQKLQNARQSQHFAEEKVHLINSKAALEAEMGSLLTHVESQTSQVHSLHSDLEAHKAQITNLAEELKGEKEASEQLARLKAELHQQLLAHQSGSDARTQELGSLIQQKEEELSARKAQEEKLLSQLEQVHGDLAETIQTHQREIGHHKGQTEVLQEQIGALKDQLAEEEQKNATLHSDLAELQMTLNLEMNGAHQNYNQIIRELQLAVQNKEEEIQKLAQREEDTHKKLNNLVQAKDESQATALHLQTQMENEMAVIKLAFDQETQKVRSLETLLEHQTTQLQKLAEELKNEKKLSQEISLLEREVQETLKHTANQKDSTIQDLQSEIHAKETQLSEIYFTQNTLKDDLEVSQKRMVQLLQDREDEKNHLNSQVILLKNELLDMTDALKGKEGHTDSLQQEIEEKQALLTKLTHNLTQANEKLEELMAALNKAETELKEKDGHLAELKDKISQLESNQEKSE